MLTCFLGLPPLQQGSGAGSGTARQLPTPLGQDSSPLPPAPRLCPTRAVPGSWLSAEVAPELPLTWPWGWALVKGIHTFFNAPPPPPQREWWKLAAPQPHPARPAGPAQSPVSGERKGCHLPCSPGSLGAQFPAVQLVFQASLAEHRNLLASEGLKSRASFLWAQSEGSCRAWPLGFGTFRPPWADAHS